MVFRNDTDNDTEGEFLFPMSDESVMCGYAVDINGVLVDGVVVEREKARVTFESEARNIVEKPSVSIAEHVVGNIFKTRVFPVPKNDTRVIKVTYVEELNTNNGIATYNLPLNFPSSIENYTVSVLVDGGEGGIPMIDSDMETRTMSVDHNLETEKKLNKNGEKYEMSWFNLKNQTIRKGIQVTIPQFTQKLIVEKDHMSDIFFAINDTVQKPADSWIAPKPESIGLLWDSSFSRREIKTRQKDNQILVDLISKLNDVWMFMHSDLWKRWRIFLSNGGYVCGRSKCHIRVWICCCINSNNTTGKFF